MLLLTIEIYIILCIDLVRDLLDSNPNYSNPDGAHNTVGYIDKRRQMVNNYFHIEYYNNRH